MPTLTINGRSVTVGDEFTKLPREQQDATVDEIARSMNSQQEQDNTPGIVSGTVRAAATGVPILGGLLNRGEALLDAAGSYALNGFFPKDQQLNGSLGDRYRQAFATQNGQDQQFSQAHPVVNTAAQIAGGVGSAIPFGGMGLVGRTGAAGMTGVPGLLARSGITAAEGGAVGAGDALTRGQDIPSGAALGLFGGAVGSFAGDAAGGVARAFRPASTRAQEIVSQLAQHDGLNQVSANDGLRELGKSGVIADLGSNLQQGARAVASNPGDAQRVILDALTGRAGNAGQRVEQAADAALGRRTNVLQTADQIARVRSASASPLYERAYASDVPMTDELRDILQRPAVQQAFGHAQRLAQNAGEPFDAANPNVMALDYTKRALDDAISSNLRAGNNNEARILINNRDALVSHVDAAVPEYAQARQAFSSHSAIAQALQDGQDVFRNTVSPDMLRRQLAGMSEDQRAAFQEGARQQVAQTMGTARNDANAARSMFDKGYNREKLETVIGAPQSDAMLQAIDAERQFGRTLDQAQGGSRTDRNILAQQIIPGQTHLPVLRSLLNMKFGDAAEGALHAVAQPVMDRRNADLRTEIANLLMSRNTDALAPVAPDTRTQRRIAAAMIGASPEPARQ